MKNVLYKDFILYNFTEDIKNIDCYSSNFLMNWKKYLEDEEYIKDDVFVRCPYCDSEKIKTTKAFDRNFGNFIKSNNLYYSHNSKYSFFYLKETLELMTILPENKSICFCESCHKVITASNKPFFINYYVSSSDYEKIFRNENFFSKYNEPLICPFCNSKHFFSEEIDKYELIYCVSCKHYICTTEKTCEFINYHININKLGKQFLF